MGLVGLDFSLEAEAEALSAAAAAAADLGVLPEAFDVGGGGLEGSLDLESDLDNKEDLVEGLDGVVAGFAAGFAVGLAVGLAAGLAAGLEAGAFEVVVGVAFGGNFNFVEYGDVGDEEDCVGEDCGEEWVDEGAEGGAEEGVGDSVNLLPNVLNTIGLGPLDCVARGDGLAAGFRCRIGSTPAFGYGLSGLYFVAAAAWDSCRYLAAAADTLER